MRCSLRYIEDFRVAFECVTDKDARRFIDYIDTVSSHHGWKCHTMFGGDGGRTLVNCIPVTISGRVLISEVITDSELPEAIKLQLSDERDELLWGE